MNLGLHIINFPSGNFGFVGSIPNVMCNIVTASKSDVLGGRAFYDQHGTLVTAKAPSFSNINDAVAHAEKFGFEWETLPSLRELII